MTSGEKKRNVRSRQLGRQTNRQRQGDMLTEKGESQIKNDAARASILVQRDAKVYLNAQLPHRLILVLF